jgi:hypothetical protein
MKERKYYGKEVGSLAMKIAQTGSSMKHMTFILVLISWMNTLEQVKMLAL